ncbi:MAG TPA: GIY-YIG nuclease family protein [Chloroflexota bacterium]
MGPKPWKHPIVALGAARLGQRGAVERFETLVRPLPGARPCRVPKYLERLGVRAEELDEAPPPERALAELLAFAGEARLVGLDVGVAVARLQFALREAGRPPLENRLVEVAVAEQTRPDLLALARRRGLAVPPRPTAGALAELALRLAAGSEPADDEAPSALAATAWRRLLDARALGSIPEAPGVYRFLDRAGRRLYIGKATSLRARLASYLTGQFALIRSMPGLVEATDRLEHEVLPCELAARAREAELIAEHRPAYNVQRRPDPELRWAALDLDGEPPVDGTGVPRLRLRLTATRSPGAELATAAAARAAFRRLRRGWWAPRPTRAARPTAEAVVGRHRELVGRLAAELRAGPIAGGLVNGDLGGGLLVIAPARPIRSADLTDQEPDEGWTRERYDGEWPPVGGPLDWTGDEPVEWDEPAEAVWEDAVDRLEPEADSRAAMVVGPDGLRWTVALPAEAGAGEAEIRRLAEEALGDGRTMDAGSAAGLAALSVVLTALRRGETGVRAWPLRGGGPWA